MPTILHISDIHRTPDEPVTNDEILNALVADLRKHSEEGIPAADVLVISGDLVQAAEPEEYQEAKQLVEQLMDVLALPRERLVVVPGNHDIHWPTAEEAFRLRREKPRGLDEALVISHNAEFLCALSEADYQRRLKNFRDFYFAVKGMPYPEDRSEQFTVHNFPELNVSIAALSSCDLNDHWRFHGRLNVSALRKAGEAIKAFSGLKAVVWHHDLNWYGEAMPDCLDLDSFRHAGVHPYSLALCGHRHRPAVHNVCTVAELPPLPLVAAGSLCAGKRQRVDSVPRSYHVIDMAHDKARIHVRFKEQRSSPWVGIARFKNEHSQDVCWFDVPYLLPSNERSRAPLSGAKRLVTDAKPATPFGEMNAKTMAKNDVVSQYVWTEVAARLDTDAPQIVLGPRGSGKTALLLSVTWQGRMASSHYRQHPALALRRIGLMCPMNVGEITAFNGKGWLTRDERTQVFRGAIATFWAQELVSALEAVGGSPHNEPLDTPTQSEAARLLSSLWFAGFIADSYSSLRVRIKQLRSQLISTLSTRNRAERHKQFNLLARNPLVRGGPGLLTDAATELARWSAYSSTRWIVLFDEVEYLNEWQQQAVYAYLAHSSGEVSAKIATLPYAHARAIRRGSANLTVGHDYFELPISLINDGEPEDALDTAMPKSFAEIARGVWKARLEAAGLQYLSFEDLWPEVDYEQLAGQVLGLPGGQERNRLEERLLDQFRPDTKERAQKLRTVQRNAFLDQYWRRYQQPFRFRLAQKTSGLPLYWGWKTLLRACDGNCRWFLQLADECWRSYWSRDGFRPLTPEEQHNALMQWADSVYRVCGSLTEKGEELKRVVDQVGSELNARLYGARFLVEEALTVVMKSLSRNQAEAVAIGVAFGLLVPRSTSASDISAYPTSNVQLRLGFPIAAAKKLPLRPGATLTIRDLRQVSFPWLQD